MKKVMIYHVYLKNDIYIMIIDHRRKHKIVKYTRNATKSKMKVMKRINWNYITLVQFLQD